jgi:hypothetical protein
LLLRLHRGESPGVALPSTGEGVWIRRPSSEVRLRARVGSSSGKRLSLVENQGAPEPFHARNRVELDWIGGAGLARVTARILAVRTEPPAVLDIEVKGTPRLAERRELFRVAATLPVSGWSLQDPTRLLKGQTIDVSSRGALLTLPMTPETATTLELTIELQGMPFNALGRIVRATGDLIAVVLEPTRPEDAARLAAFVEDRQQAARATDEGPAAPPGRDP